MIIRAKKKGLFLDKILTDKQKKNSKLNIKEMNEGAVLLKSLPRRIVFELTNDCNLNCIMCGRSVVDFQTNYLSFEDFSWFEPLFDTIEEVTLMGWGEPTMHPNFADMLRILDKYNVRKYFCTNGMNLDNIKDMLFDYNVDLMAISVSGSTAETNNRISKGSDFNQKVASLRAIVSLRNEKQRKWPYISFVFCAMKSNLNELPRLVDLAANIGVNKVKVVYLTAFSKKMLDESLWGLEEEVQTVFNETYTRAKQNKIDLELPYISGEDPAFERYHSNCFVGWRDFFLGSDGFIRPCMSTTEKFIRLNKSKSFFEIWNSEEFMKHRKCVNITTKMSSSCKRCYQSSYCNWNLEKSFIQVDEIFFPKWISSAKK